jgi:hypothetical protein
VRSIFTLLLAIILWTFLYPLPAHAQIGGQYTYGFLNIANSARVAALGGNVLAIKDNDVTLTLANPSLITPEMSNNLAFSYVNFFTGNNFGFVQYARSFSKVGSFVGTFQFMDYGKFTEADQTGTITGEFSASEYALNVGWGRTLSPLFSVGANAKLIYSHLDLYNSFGIAVDVAGTYLSKNQLFTASLLARNIGSQIVPYTSGVYEPLPFDLQGAMSLKFAHIPFRIHVILDHLTKWDLSYTDPNDPSNQADPYTGQVQEKTGFAEFTDNLMRHIDLGGEVIIAKVLGLRLGYNYERRQEMKLSGKAGMSGFSYGFGLRVKMFNFSYTHATYQAGGINPNYVTVTANLGGFAKKD